MYIYTYTYFARCELRAVAPALCTANEILSGQTGHGGKGVTSDPGQHDYPSCRRWCGSE